MYNEQTEEEKNHRELQHIVIVCVVVKVFMFYGLQCYIRWYFILNENDLIFLLFGTECNLKLL